MKSSVIDSPEAQVLASVVGREFGSVVVHDGRYEFDLSADGQPLVRFILTLDDPAPGTETWPLSDIYALDREVDQTAESLGIESRWSTSIQQTTPEEFADEQSAD